MGMTRCCTSLLTFTQVQDSLLFPKSAPQRDRLRRGRRRGAPLGRFAVNETNALATQTVELFTEEECGGETAIFDSSANEAVAAFAPFVKNLRSARLCGKGTFFYFSSEDMQTLSTLGHITRCGADFGKSKESCTCVNVKRRCS